MLSKITIEVDFDNSNKPVLQIISRNSDDVRDKLIKKFIEIVSGAQWCKIECKGMMPETAVSYDAQKWLITPISIPEFSNWTTSDATEPSKDKYVCMELRDLENRVIGVDILLNGDVAHTWKYSDRETVK